MFELIRERFRRGKSVTSSYPTVAETTPPLFRGMPHLDPTLCLGHATCATVCPTGALTVEAESSGGWTWRLDRARCSACGACADVCPTGAISIDPQFELAARNRADLVTTVRFQPSPGEETQ